MTELLEHDPKSGSTKTFADSRAPSSGIGVADEVAVRDARRSLRDQIARMERDLSELFASASHRHGIDWRVGAAGGPRVLGLAELERIRDDLADRLAGARGEIARRAEAEEESRALVERMIADPAAHRWTRVRSEDVGERSCKHWHVRPRWGLLGMIAGWWRVKLSSGCPLACGACPERVPPQSPIGPVDR
ncbi:MAG: hypothetical protein U0R51_06780 [Solirubrobacterales bacterium]